MANSYKWERELSGNVYQFGRVSPHLPPQGWQSANAVPLLL